MVYKALYRTYRPQTFEEIAGQEHIVKTLKNAIKENRIGHAYLFCGPRGTGKTTVAKILAKAINCESNEGKPCNQCVNCQSLMSGDHPDIIEIDAASNNGVDEVRNLIDKVKYAPIQGKYKVYIIDEVHMMSTGAFNALLKTLEEPPAHVVFVLATTDPQKVIPTIVSRCQRFDFTRVSEKDIVDRIHTVLKGENIECEEEAIEMIAKLSDGGMRDALSILEQCLAYSNEKLTVADINEIYGLISTEQKIKFVRILLSKNMQKSLSQLDFLLGKGTDIKRLTYDLIDLFKDIIIYHNTKESTLLKVLTSSNIQSISPYISTEECFEFIEVLLDAANHYYLGTNQNIYFEMAILKICNKVTEGKVELVEEQEETSEEVYEEDAKEIIDEPEQTSVEEEMVEELEQTIVDEVEDEQPQLSLFEEKEEEKPQLTLFEEVKEEEKQPQLSLFEEKEEEPKKELGLIKISFDDILNILVQADRRVLNESREKWQIIRRYMSNMNTAKWAGMLVEGEPVAAAEGGLILSFEFQPEANLVNYYENYDQLKRFVKEILGRDFDFIAVTRTNWVDIRNQYLKLRQVNKLPSPKKITLGHIDQYRDRMIKDTRTDAQKLAQSLFGDIVEIVEEDYEH